MAQYDLVVFLMGSLVGILVLYAVSKLAPMFSKKEPPPPEPVEWKTYRVAYVGGIRDGRFTDVPMPADAQPSPIMQVPYTRADGKVVHDMYQLAHLVYDYTETKFFDWKGDES